ncbi:MAG: hypothetical protein RMK84_14050 [Oscillochloridaceae bacterium]|nr:hypothetical protein [Oscillochloridaceae bacterium]
MEHLPPWLRNLPLPSPPTSRDQPGSPAEDEGVPEWLHDLRREVREEAGTGPAETPEWLRDLRREVREEAGTGPAETPEWLRDLRREVREEAETGPAETPEWLRDLDQPAPPVEPSPRTPPLGATSWLSSLGSDEPAAPQEAPPPADQPTTSSRIKMPEGVTDWLRSIGDDPDAPSEPVSGPVSEPLDPSGLPDWLRELHVDELDRAVEGESPPPLEREQTGALPTEKPSADVSTVPAQQRPSSPLAQPSEPLPEEPDWLREFVTPEEQKVAPTLEAQADLAAEAEVPTWLREITDASRDALQAENPAAAPMADQELPAWLREVAQTSDTSAPAEGQELPAWLREAEPARPPASGDELPTWLREAAETAERPPAAEGREEIPAWLQDAAEPPSQPAGQEVPAWLREAEPARPPASGDELPTWLREAAETAERPPVAEGREEIPAWLQDAAEPPSQPAGQKVPAWLREAAETAETPPAVEGQEIPAWLQDAVEPPPQPAVQEVPPWLYETPAAQTPATEEPSVPGDDVPPWLLAAESADQVPAATGGAKLDLPAWLHDAPAEPAPSPVASAPESPGRVEPGVEEGDSGGFLRGAELPGWLRVPEPELPAETAAGQQLDWLRRLGGIEAEESEIETPVAAAVVTRSRRMYQPTAEQLGAMRLLEQLAATPYPTPAPATAPVEETRRRLDLHRLLYALLALALLIALLAPQITLPFRSSAPVTENATALGALLDGLNDDDVVLMAYEWAAQRSGELRPLEEAVTRRLIANRTKLILVSTDLQGALLSFDLIEPLRAAGYNNENGVSFGGRDYVLLGYRPGGDLAVRGLAQDLRGALASDFDGQDASQGLVANYPDGTPRIRGIEDLALIVVLADQPQDVQVWMEQVHQQVRDQVPIAFLLPQDAQPLAQPYLRLPNVYAIAGQQGALALLASDPTADPSALSRATGQLAFAVAAFLVLLLLGASASAFMRQRAASGGAR